MKVELAKLPARLRLPLAEMLQSMVGREVNGQALDSGLPGQVVRLKLGGQILKALLQARGVQEGQSLMFRVEKEGSQFFLKLLEVAAGDPALRESSGLKDFLFRLGASQLEFFHSLSELLNHWKRLRDEGNSKPGDIPSDPKNVATDANPNAKDQLHNDTSEESEQTGFLSLQGPYFLALTHSLPEQGPSLFVFYSRSPDFDKAGLLVVQPDASQRMSLQQMLETFQDDSLQSVLIMDRFPDPGFFGTGQLWQA
ncbi:MAG: hypothetical protein KDK23_15285 [Leptospiraceae bacterium]|nr:hypothetical protein [Leptospiraceae bacterium]